MLIIDWKIRENSVKIIMEKCRMNERTIIIRIEIIKSKNIASGILVCQKN